MDDKMFIETISKISNFTENNIPDLSDKSAKDLRNVVKTYINFIYFIGTNDAVALPSRLFALKILPYMITYYQMIIHESNTSNKSNKKSIKRGGRSHQKGGARVKIRRGNRVMNVDERDLVEGDIILDDNVCDAVVVSAQVAAITNGTIAAQEVGGGSVFNNNSVTITRPGQQNQVVSYVTEISLEQRRNNEMLDLTHEYNRLTLEDLIDTKKAKKAITNLQAKNVLEQLSGTVTLRDYTNICSESFSAGMCCCIAIEARNQMVRNCASQTFETIVQTPYDFVSGTLGYVSGSIYNNTPSAVGDVGRMFYGWGESANAYTGSWFQYLTPQHHSDIINSTLSNSTISDATILHPSANDISCFQRVFDNYIDRTHNFLQSDSFMCCLVVSATYCCCKYSRLSQRKQQIAETHTIGTSLTEFLDNRDDKKYNQNMSTITNVAGTLLTIGGACAGNPAVVAAGNTLRTATNAPGQQRRISNSMNQGPPNSNIDDLLANGPQQGQYPTSQQGQNLQLQQGPYPQLQKGPYPQLQQGPYPPLQQGPYYSPQMTQPQYWPTTAIPIQQVPVQEVPQITNPVQEVQGPRRRRKGGKPTKKKSKKSNKSKKIRN